MRRTVRVPVDVLRPFGAAHTLPGYLGWGCVVCRIGRRGDAGQGSRVPLAWIMVPGDQDLDEGRSIRQSASTLCVCGRGLNSMEGLGPAMKGS